MPELPEVETVARTLLPHISGSVIMGSELLRESTLHPLSLPLESLRGLVIKDTWRRGKLLLINLEGGKSENRIRPAYIVMHLRMTGRVFPGDINNGRGNHTRCVFHLRRPDGDMVDLFFDDTRAFGKIMAATPEILEQWKFWRELGPEPLEIDAKTFAQRLYGARAIKTALLDQKVIAGIGNIYADEALFQARINPLRAASSLSNKESSRLLAALRDVLRRSISQCGSSIRDYRDANGNVGAFQNTFMAYGRAGLPCKVCGQVMSKTRLGGRATVFCPSCQKFEEMKSEKE